MTALATLAVLPATEDDASAKAAADRSVRWLERTKTDDDPQSVAMRLVVFARLEKPPSQLLPLIHRIQERQRQDGSWSPELLTYGLSKMSAFFVMTVPGSRNSGARGSPGKPIFFG